MDWPAVTAVVREVGFPAAVAIFVLVRLNGTIISLRNAVVTLTVELGRHNDVMGAKATAIHEAITRIDQRGGIS